MKFSTFCQENQSTIAMTAIEQAIAEANQLYPEAKINSLSEPPPSGQWYQLDTDNPKYKGKFSLILNEVTTKNGTVFPTAVIHCHKDAQNITANVAWSLFQGETPIINIAPQEKKVEEKKAVISFTCPNCGKSHTGNQATCFYCRIDALYKETDSDSLGHHPYVQAKGLPVELWREIGAVCKGNWLIIPLQGTEGYQVISGCDTKLYAVKEGMGQAHIIIGEFDPHNIQVCEGIATGMSCYLATGQAVIVTLDINGLKRNVDRLRQQYPNSETHKITILADNDVVIDTLSNPGVDAAMALAKSYNCMVAIPEDSIDPNRKVDFDDIRRDYGLDDVRLFIEQATTPTVSGFLSEWADISNVEVVHIEPYQLVDGKYLDPSLLKSFLTNNLAEGNEPIIIGVKSPKGSGKTRSITRPVLDFAYANDLTFGYISPLQNLSRNAANDLNILVHLEFDDIDKLKDKPYLAYCINGVTNNFWRPDQDTEYYDIVVLDEVKMILESIVSGTVKNKLIVYDKLLKMIQHAKMVVCLDADLDVETIKQLIMGYMGRVVIVDNPDQNWSDREVVMTDDATVKTKGHSALYQGKRVIMAVGSIRRAEALEQIYKRRHPDKNIWLITGKTVKDYQEFISDPNSVLERDKPDMIIYTTVIGSGFSIDLEGYFDECLLFGSKHLTPNTLHQMMGRYRHWKRFTCSIPKVGFYSDKDRADYYKEIFDKADLELESLSHNSVITVDRTHPYYDLVADIQFAINESLRNLQANFEAKVEESGATLIQGQVKTKEDQSLITKSLALAQLKARQTQAEKAYQLHQENPMSDKEAKRYTKSQLLRGGDDYLRFIAYQYEQFYKVPVTVEGLIKDSYGARQTQIVAYERYLMTRDEVERLSQQIINESMTPYGLDATGVKAYVTMWDLCHNLLRALGGKIDDNGLLDVSSINKFTRETLLDNADFMKFLQENKDRINRSHLGFTVTDNTIKEPIKFVLMVLDKIGLKVYNKRSGNKRRYFICQDELTSLNEIVTRRREHTPYQPVNKRLLQANVTQESYTEEIEGVIYQLNDDGTGQIVQYLDDTEPPEPDLSAVDRPIVSQMACL